ncbi:PREDICTED: ovomucoid-like [Thamnophis sirtalis]|uniref:Ovomucoid-like n=1 Tax=Thamnophis sirtalis TaxID=35019 RepID=A0A6I9Z4W0_9SAUR|nr:PREDICTED: ovomucoid-like [Thamnophis sirtalis]
MKPGSFLLLTLLLFFLYSNIAAQKINEKEYCKKYSVPSNFCTLEYNPHCASNGKTYGNKCGFCNGYIKSGRKLRLRYLGKCVKFEDAED